MWPSHFLFAAAALALFAGLTAPVQAGNPRFQEATSPDDARIAYVNAADGDAEIYVEASGLEPLRLTSNDCFDNEPDWSPDGKRIAFASNRTGQWQIHRMDADGGRVEQITHEATGCVKPRHGTRGELAYLVSRGRIVKRDLYDLVISDGDKRITLEKSIPIWDIAWRNDGDIIACSTDGQLHVHDIRLGTITQISFRDVDPRLSHYGLFECRWSETPAGFVGRLRFLGGVRMGTKLFGDSELLIVPLNAPPRFLNTVGE